MDTPEGLPVSDQDVADLRARLRATRWPTPWPMPANSPSTQDAATSPGATTSPDTSGWEAGTEPGELRRLVEYWASGYDWRTHEQTIRALPWHTADIDGTAVRYLKFEGERPDSLPIVITHGWPSTILELVELSRRLSTPSQYGGHARDAFTVIVPALPGFPFSPQRPSLPPAVSTHDLWHRLMNDVLGFDRYAAHGGDLGAGITSRLAEAHPHALVGIHLLAVAAPADVGASPLTGDERAFLDAAALWSANEGGYQHEQSTRPVTLAYGLSDSPVGLLAWIVEKYRAWSDCGGVLSRRFSDDFILTQASLYWFTNSISTSFRPYYEFAEGMTGAVGQVTVPTAVALFPADLAQPPRSWAERTYAVARYTRMPRGGHFAAHEEPALLAADLAEFFRTLR